MSKHTLGSYLKAARRRSKLSAVEVAQSVGMDSPVTVLAWERNQGRALPLSVLKKLISLYELDVEVVFDLLLQYQITRLEQKYQKLVRKVK